MWDDEWRFRWLRRWDSVVFRIKRPFRRMKRVLEYLPVIWQNEDWDYNWFYVLVEYKLSRMEKALAEDTLHVNAERHADEVKRCRLALTRLINHQYSDDLYAEARARYGLTDFRSSHKDERYMDEVRRISKHSDYLENQDLDYFWRVFKKHHRSWWI